MGTSQRQHINAVSLYIIHVCKLYISYLSMMSIMGMCRSMRTPNACISITCKNFTHNRRIPETRPSFDSGSIDWLCTKGGNHRNSSSLMYRAVTKIVRQKRKLTFLKRSSQSLPIPSEFLTHRLSFRAQVLVLLVE